MPYAQTDRPLRVQVAGLEENAFLLQGVHGREGINFSFEFHLDLLAPTDSAPLAFEQLLGKAVSFEIAGPDENVRTIAGVFTELLRGDRDRVFTHWGATVRPPWWYGTLRTNSRIFQQKTVVEILKTVLDPFGTVDFQTSGQYPERDFTCQYRESDWKFALRLMEEEGIFFFFRHAAGGPTLVLADRVGAGAPPAADPMYYREPGAGPDSHRRHCTSWRRVQKVCPTSVAVRDSHFELFLKNFAAEAQVAESVELGQVSHPLAPAAVGKIPVYSIEGEFAKRYDGISPSGSAQSGNLEGLYPDSERSSRLRMESLFADAARCVGASNVPDLIPGGFAELAHHYDSEGKYLVLSVEHEASYRGTFRPEEAAGTMEYRNTFEFGPAATIPRPPRITPRPVLAGPLTAVVVGPKGHEIFVDKYGRIKVQFFWDRDGQFDASSSCWIRCAQIWAGKSWGAFFWPRVGMEVVVQFVDGDIDRPLVTGCVYNATNVPPTNLPVQSSIAGIKSMIVGGSPQANFNAIYIHDTPGVEYVQVHSEHSEMQHSEGSRYHQSHHAVFDIRGHL